MRYRMEKVEDDFVVCNVETDTKLGTHWIGDPQDANRSILLGHTLLNSQGTSC
jgi:hypothetical protein